MTCRLLAAFAVALLVAGSARHATAQGITAERWYEVETEHFRVHGHAAVRALIEDTAVMAEAAHALLAPIFGEPDGRTLIVVSDPFDSANGSAGVVPRRVINVYAYPPETRSTLGFHDNWLWNLIVHEYTHIVHLDTMGRGFTFLTLPFGRRWAPNQALPRWLIEGLATWQESQHSGTGRVNSGIFEMQLRTASLAGTEPRLGSLSGYPGDWPLAGAWYLFGAFFVEHLADVYGPHAWPEFIETYGRRAIPFGINATAIDVFGADFPSLYARFVAMERVRQAHWATERSLRGLTPTERLTHHGFWSDSAAWDPASETLVWLEQGGDSPRTLRWHSPAGSGSIDPDGADEIALVPGSMRVIVAQSAVVEQTVSRRDLFELDLAAGTATRLTHGARAREPAVSFDGERVVYVAPTDGRTDLWVWERSTGISRRIAVAERYALYGTPAFLADGRLVASLHTPGAGRDLVVVEVDSGAVVPLVTGEGESMTPVATPDGEWVVFSDDRDGAFELYALRLATGEQFRLTTTLTGLFRPVIGPLNNGMLQLWAAEYGSDGYDISALEVAWPPVTGVEAPRTHTVRDSFVPDIADAPPLRRHRDGRAFVPYRWMPVLSSAGGDTIAGVSLAGADITGRHDYTALLTWSAGYETPTWAAYARTGILPLGLSVSTGRTIVQRAGALVAESREVPYEEQQWTASLGTDSAFDAHEGTHRLAFDWSLYRTGFFARPTVRHRPEDVEPQRPRFPHLDSVGFSWSWSRVASAPRAISSQRGVALSVGTRLRGAWTGADADSAEVGWSARGYVAMPWNEHHVLALRGAGGLSRARGVGRRLYSLGGPAAQDVLVAMVDSLPVGSSNVRGFAPGVRTGDRYVLGNVEYRLPIARLHAGYATLPAVFERLALAVFSDAGYAGNGAMRWSQWIGGVGAEIRLETTFGYFRGASLRFGAAHGIGTDAELDIYLLYGWWY